MFESLFWRTPIFKNICEWLLVKLMYNKTVKRGHNESIVEKQKSCTKCDKGAPEISNESIDFTIRAQQSKSITTKYLVKRSMGKQFVEYLESRKLLLIRKTWEYYKTGQKSKEGNLNCINQFRQYNNKSEELVDNSGTRWNYCQDKNPSSAGYDEFGDQQYATYNYLGLTTADQIGTEYHSPWRSDTVSKVAACSLFFFHVF